jgi:hypothetical protein
MTRFPYLCNWIGSAPCREPAQVVFESGLGYCRPHAEAVNSNREWLRQFAAKWLEERQ